MKKRTKMYKHVKKKREKEKEKIYKNVTRGRV